MKRAAVLLLVLTGCNPIVRQDDLEAAKQEVRASANAIAALEERVDILEAELAETQEQVEFVEKVNTAVSEQVANNARVANENAAKDMTARAACGTELVNLGNGLSQVRRIPCTVNDLKK